ncbi:hypothetical protein CAPTEDRAFT_198475 [Capitella teleta]|uniref:Uncharacterized protein n=1 Tax=Capitella teleta TaxID=283909 RepID=R7TLM2_CAPTE|nr:hypothetical protein CAPTEDRAFT_198475 [Capitella teleta]|eukprot:ELT94728.1 hypothetical protein CAPTEDRAFT_198475 [Capitella teleta]
MRQSWSAASRSARSELLVKEAQAALTADGVNVLQHSEVVVGTAASSLPVGHITCAANQLLLFDSCDRYLRKKITGSDHILYCKVYMYTPLLMESIVDQGLCIIMRLPVTTIEMDTRKYVPTIQLDANGQSAVHVASYDCRKECNSSALLKIAASTFNSDGEPVKNVASSLALPKHVTGSNSILEQAQVFGFPTKRRVGMFLHEEIVVVFLHELTT